MSQRINYDPDVHFEFTCPSCRNHLLVVRKPRPDQLINCAICTEKLAFGKCKRGHIGPASEWGKPCRLCKVPLEDPFQDCLNG